MDVSRQIVPERFLALDREALPILRMLSPDLSLEEAKDAIVAGILAERAVEMVNAQRGGSSSDTLPEQMAG